MLPLCLFVVTAIAFDSSSYARLNAKFGRYSPGLNLRVGLRSLLCQSPLHLLFLSCQSFHWEFWVTVATQQLLSESVKTALAKMSETITLLPGRADDASHVDSPHFCWLYVSWRSHRDKIIISNIEVEGEAQKCHLIQTHLLLGFVCQCSQQRWSVQVN